MQTSEILPELNSEFYSASPIDGEPLFNAKNFLQSFRVLAAQRKLSFGGPTTAEHKEFDQIYHNEAKELAIHHSEQIARFAGRLSIKPSVFCTKYTEEFVKSARFVGRNIVQLKKSNPEFFAIFSDDEKRSAIFLQLSRDFRRNSHSLSEEALRKGKIIITPLESSKPHIHEPEKISRVVKQHKNYLGFSYIIKVLRSRSYDIEEHLEVSSKKIKSLRRSNRFKDLPMESIKKAVAYHTDPESYLQRLVSRLKTKSSDSSSLPLGIRLLDIAKRKPTPGKDIKTLQKTYERLAKKPEYLELGNKSIFHKAIRLRPEDPESVVNEILSTYRQLINDQEFQEIQSGHIKRIATSYITLARSMAVLRLGLENYRRLVANTKFTSFFNNQALLDTALHRKYNADKFLDSVIIKYHRLRKISRFQIVDDSTIKRVLIMSPKEYLPRLEAIVSRYQDFCEDPKYQYLPRFIIKNISNRQLKDYASELDKKLYLHFQYIKQEQLADKLHPMTIRDIFDDKGRGAKRYIKGIAKKFEHLADSIDLVNLSPHFIGYALTYHPANTIEFLHKAQDKLLSLFQDDRFGPFGLDYIQNVLLEDFDGAKERLEESADTIDKILADKRLSNLRPDQIRKAVIKFGPKKSYAILLHLDKKTK